MSEVAEKIEENENLKHIMDVLYGYVRGHRWRQIHFSESGQARMASIIGWITGLAHGGSIELANSLADDLAGRLDFLNNYGGTTDVTPKDSGKKIELPRFKVVLHDDGTFNGFSFLKYGLITRDQVYDKAKEIDREAWIAESTEYPTPWELALEKAYKHFRIDKSLEDYRTYFPTWDDDRKHLQYVWGYYGFSHNGGLLYHGPGKGQVYAVTIGTVRAWSIHT
tara:strand:+ start:1424 stop:2092 length:669 start_codon:yes stop_codon:yes gene_type:complete